MVALVSLLQVVTGNDEHMCCFLCFPDLGIWMPEDALPLIFQLDLPCTELPQSAARAHHSFDCLKSHLNTIFFPVKLPVKGTCC